MNKSILKKTLEIMAEEGVPTDLNGWPKIHTRFFTNQPQETSKRHSIKNGENKMGPRIARPSNLQIMFISLLITILVLAGLLVTPEGTTWAMAALRFFTRSNTVPVLPTLQPASLVAVTPGTILPTLTQSPSYIPPFSAQCGDLNDPKCTVDQIRGLVSFPVKTIANLPEGLKYIGATGGPEGVTLFFRTEDMTSVLMLTQGPQTGNEANDWKVGSNATVETVSIGNNSGEYIQGLWNNSPGNTVSIWDPNIPRQVLRWIEGDVVITMTWFGNPDLATIRVDKTGLLLLANEMTTSSITQKDATNLKSAVEAGKMIGFDVIEPAWLPNGYAFTGADALIESKTVCLHYRHQGDDTPIDIAESVSSPLPALSDLFPLDPTYGRNMTTETLSVGGGKDGQGLYATGNLNARYYCGSAVDNKVLQVQTSNLVFSIYSPDYSDYAPTHMEMVKIAESITGVVTIPNDRLDPERLYSIAYAEKLAGFHLLQPTKLPEGKIFAYATYAEEGEQKTVKLVYTDYRGSISISETLNPTDSLKSIYNNAPEMYDKVSVNGQPALISQGFYNNKVWMKLVDGGDGGVSVIWFVDMIKYEIAGFNGLPTKEWLAIAESLK